jgi:methylated-DNA-[protein]-cysteine S-methyltransferase
MRNAGTTATYCSAKYDSPVGTIELCSDGQSLCGLWMEGQKYFEGTIPGPIAKDGSARVLGQAAEWLDRYFAGEKPTASELPLAPIGGAFRQAVWSRLAEIPYGEVTTYGALAEQVAQDLGRDRMAAVAVGGAVGHNPISIIIPCHRVVGANGSLTGYAGGIRRKVWLLEHEGADMSKLYVPAKGTAL